MLQLHLLEKKNKTLNYSNKCMRLAPNYCHKKVVYVTAQISKTYDLNK